MPTEEEIAELLGGGQDAPMQAPAQEAAETAMQESQEPPAQQMQEQAAGLEQQQPPAPPTWEEFSQGKVKSAEEFEALYNKAKAFEGNDDAVKVAQMWMTGEDIEPLLAIHSTNFDKMDPETLFYRDWEARNQNLVGDEELTPAELKEEFMEYMKAKFQGYDPDEEYNGLGKVKDKIFKSEAEAIREEFKEAKKSALQLRLEKKPEAAPEIGKAEEQFLTPEEIGRNVKEAEDFKSFDFGAFEGENVSIPVPDEWRSVATEAAKDPGGAYEGQYFEKSEDGKEVFNHKKFQKDMFVVNHLDKIAKYFYDLGKGVTAEEQAIALGQKPPKAIEENPEAGGELEALIAKMEAQKA